MSRKILTELLRSELHFEGVVASDDLALRAIADHQSIADAAVSTLRAGADALLVCQERERAVEAFAAIEAAVTCAFSPMPPVKTSACKPPSAAANEPSSRPIR